MKRLVAFLDAFRGGADMETAARRASIDPVTARRFIDALKMEILGDALGAGAAETGKDAEPQAAGSGHAAELQAAAGSGTRGETGTPAKPRMKGKPGEAKRTGMSGKKGGPRAGRLTAHTDGASRGNPGEASCAVILYDDENEELLRRAKRLGVTTNNVAEYEGVLLALEMASALGASGVRIKLDSELVARQLNGVYKVKHPVLVPLHGRALSLMGEFDEVEVIHVGRAENKAADKLANEALDGKA